MALGLVVVLVAGGLRGAAQARIGPTSESYDGSGVECSAAESRTEGSRVETELFIDTARSPVEVRHTVSVTVPTEWWVVGGRYLRTAADDTEQNNLDNLPRC
jgi:hypothetical protein